MAEKRSHVELGRALSLFFQDESSPGSIFWLPKGMHVYNSLQALLRKLYVKHGYSEVQSPNMFKNDLWKRSGHWDKYAANMFRIEGDDMSLKPMNCPSHCVMFSHMNLSHNDLPLRLADFGVLHRNELSGSLHGLLRVRRFCQDDAHIFCRESQIRSEIQNVLNLIREVYSQFGFHEYKVEMSSRPKEYIGELDLWDKAESILKEMISQFPEWEINEGDGAFYGPKIDIQVRDSLGRLHQCGTVQLDFNLPQRFNLEFRNEQNQMERPVMIHRAILGSLERFIAILLEHCQGKLPFCVSPNKIMVIPVKPELYDYAQQVRDFIESQGFPCCVDLSGEMFNKKIRNSRYFAKVLIVGEKEKGLQSVNDRDSRKNLNRDELVAVLKSLI